MTYIALVNAFAQTDDLPIPVDAVLDWIRANTDHKYIRLHAVGRAEKEGISRGLSPDLHTYRWHVLR